MSLLSLIIRFNLMIFYDSWNKMKLYIFSRHHHQRLMVVTIWLSFPTWNKMKIFKIVLAWVSRYLVSEGLWPFSARSAGFIYGWAVVVRSYLYIWVLLGEMLDVSSFFQPLSCEVDSSLISMVRGDLGCVIFYCSN